MSGHDYIRIIVERHWRDDGSGFEQDVVRVHTDAMYPAHWTGYSDKEIAALVWRMIARTAFLTDNPEDIDVDDDEMTP